MSFNAFEHKLLNHLKPSSRVFEGQKIYVSCSGGLDSVVLFESLLALKQVLNFSKVVLLHVHHGRMHEGNHEHKNQSDYRDEALNFCKKLSLRHKVDFVSFESDEFLKSEEECRDFRKKHYAKFKNIFLGQHKDDFLETIVIRLIRGTGAQGLKEPFNQNQNIYRPFLNLFSKNEILDYAQNKEISFLEDPSNQSDDYLRNWVRNKWLPMLDDVDGFKGFSRSLEIISEHFKSNKQGFLKEVVFTTDKEGELTDQVWLALDKYQKQSTLAYILLKLVKSGYTSSQVNEAVRVLDQNPGDTRFKSGGVEWSKEHGLIKFKLA